MIGPPHFFWQEDGGVIRERKMKEEEEEVDVDSMDIDVLPDASTTAGTAGLSSNSQTSSSLSNGSDIAGLGAGPSQSPSSRSNTNDPTTRLCSNSCVVDVTPTWYSITKEEASSATATASTMIPTPALLMSCCSGRVGDEDSIWADEDLDEDVKGWKMNVVAGLAEEIGV